MKDTQMPVSTPRTVDTFCVKPLLTEYIKWLVSNIVCRSSPKERILLNENESAWPMFSKVSDLFRCLVQVVTLRILEYLKP